MKLYGQYHIDCIADGISRWSETISNTVYDEGEYMILDVMFRNGTAPSAYYMGLMKSTLPLPAETATLASLKSPTNYELDNGGDPGYSIRQTINRDATASGWPTLVLDSGDYMITSKTVSWTATGDWTDIVKYLFLTSVASVADTTGKLISLAQLSTPRTVYSGDTLNVTYNLKLQ